ncbi:glycosyl transferase group 1 [Chthoniobacter flavus Ellin428]|uniref:Glycosyl transferase group 1 n=1 Tax=Chthoniobacter flavus Ellin428 TaxID=497964 RepID=B4D7H1_9BACT|nr:glycosyltransferase family 4 protein [Chthoniobacter flavus]EDY17588.1 glycosyl transferase group 1 [Chthoniobacter flavus Ellin428]TCO92381.1 glycosyltransferase involved in cell wall biosynthesis [Chthoniobacter flavus]
MDSSPNTKHIAFLGDYIPRRCGIATFTADICEAVATAFPQTQCIVGSVNDRPEGYEYPERVRFEIDERELDSYRRAAEFLNINNVEVLSVQHEFGIYGGPAGSHLLTLLREVRRPIVTTLHTVLSEPNPDQRMVMEQLNQLSNRFIVMAERGQRMLESVYGVDPGKIDLIPHGVIDMPFIDSNFFKDIFGVEGKTVLLTFGLLSPNKGIEYVIEALPAILKRHPNVVYLVLGATHPHLLAHEGEAYRERLEQLAKKRGVANQVIFHNRFVTVEELKEFIGAADIYITPYLNVAQVTSGTLAYTFGAGKAIISTPYWHAQELLAGDRGVLVPFRDAPGIAEGVNHFLSNPTLMTAMRKRAWKAGREMIWPVVAERYMESFERARASLSRPSVEMAAVRTIENANYPMPPLKLDHLYTMSDHTGIFQHAIYNVPNYHEGYCTDDNARAFIFTVLLQEAGERDSRLDRLASSYLAFLWYAFDANTCRFRNFMSHHREWIERAGSEDSHARALWAVGTALGRSRDHGHRSLCALLFQRGLSPVARFSSPRAWAFAILAIHEYLRAFSGDRVVSQMRDVLAGQLLGLYRANAGAGWQWFEQTVTYDNAKLSHALILSGYWTSNGEMLDIGLTSLRWLLEAQTADSGHFTPIGCHGFWIRGGERARFDQQPLEAHAMLSACLEAFAVTRDTNWRDAAQQCFEWFLGRNDLGEPLYDPTTGGCRDALLQDHLNQNQGAESSLAFYLSHAELTLVKSRAIETPQTCAA